MTTTEADTKAITAIDTPSLRIPFTSKDSVVAQWGAHNTTKNELATKRHKKHKMIF